MTSWLLILFIILINNYLNTNFLLGEMHLIDVNGVSIQAVFYLLSEEKETVVTIQVAGWNCLSFLLRQWELR